MTIDYSEFPFLSGITYMGKDYVCIIQNSSSKIISFYDYEMLKSDEDKKLFMQYGDIWAWESNRMIPINIFIGKEMSRFRYCLRTVPTKEVTVNFGPCTSLNKIIQKRIKRRQISILKKF